MSTMQTFRDGPVDTWWLWRWVIEPTVTGFFAALMAGVDLLVAWGLHSLGMTWTHALLGAVLYAISYLALKVRAVGKSESQS